MRPIKIIRRGKKINVLRFGEVEFIKGLPQPRPVTENFVAIASVQPLTGMERLQVPEGDRNREHIVIFVEPQHDIRVDDTVLYNCREFEVRVIDEWEDQGLGLVHKRCIAMLKDVNDRLIIPNDVGKEFNAS